MELIITNDDGFEAVGLETLASTAAAFGRVVRVAPLVNWSVCSHRVTTHEVLRARQRAEDDWTVEGTPADCVRLALARLAPGAEWVLAGMNHGGNLGADVHHSGTVAAVREAALHGKAGMAFSHYRKRNLEIDFTRASNWIRRVLQQLLPRPIAPGTYWNVNFPNLCPEEPEPNIIECPLDTSPLPLSFREEGGGYFYDGNYHERVRQPGADVEVCFGGNISVTLLRV